MTSPATKAARARHEAGRQRLLTLFFPLRRADGKLELDVSRMRFVHRQALGRRVNCLPWRSRPNTPPIRTAEQKQRKRRRAAVKASRRRNRS